MWGGGVGAMSKRPRGALGWLGLSFDSHTGLCFGCRAVTLRYTTGPSPLSAVTPHSGSPLVPRLGPPPLSRAPLAVPDRSNEDSPSALCLRPGRGRDGAAPGRAPGPFQSTGHRGTVPVHRAPRDLSSAPGTAGPFQSTGHRGTIPVHRALLAGDSVKLSNRKPALEEERRIPIVIYAKSGEHTTPGDEPKKETNSDEKPLDKTNHGDKPKDGDGPGNGPGDGHGNGAGNGPKDGDNPGDNGSVIGTVIGATVGAGLALVGLPVCLGALGFTGAGIAAGSIAAKMMSAAAIANGGGVAAGSTVAVLQSVGAAGLSLGSAGAAGGALLSKGKKPPSD
ncbi:uncharacterized protein LOC119711235 [Motacilla alba alba]|uniref:uncharacterized protein LOC119711235 n=1 Tax=Motacilla alba alba TaxID=1094192 RepID=UPI0018D4F46D|nr:uncharacterized protein LOC119711235 [Motacilla alba alba]